MSVAANQWKGLKMTSQMTKSQLIERIAAENEVAKKDVKGVLETLATIGYKELRRRASFSFLDLQSSLSSRNQPQRREKVQIPLTANR